MVKALIHKNRVQKNRFFGSALFIKRRSWSFAAHEVCILYFIFFSGRKLNRPAFKIEELDLILALLAANQFFYIFDR